MSQYPTMGEVEAADRRQLAQWYRFLPSPGTSTIEFDHHALSEKITKEEEAILARILERFKELGGFSPEISKSVGWVS